MLVIPRTKFLIIPQNSEQKSVIDQGIDDQQNMWAYFVAQKNNDQFQYKIIRIRSMSRMQTVVYNGEQSM